MADTSRSLAVLTASPRGFEAAAGIHPTPLPSIRPATAEPAAEDAADRATQERVHAWYKARLAAANSPSETTDPAPADDPAPAKVAATAKPRLAAPSAPDLSPVARKATADDFQRAAERRTQVIREQQQTQARISTADDDAAEAASHIPSTAPTERVAAPFVHGDLLADLPASARVGATAEDFTVAAARPATLTSRQPAPPRTAPARTDNAALNQPQAVQIASAPPPKFQLPRPAPVVRSAPAAAAAAAQKPQVDPEVVEGMTDETFTTTDSPATSARNAIALSGKTGPPQQLKAVRQDDGDDDGIPEGTTDTVKVNLYDDRGKLMVIPPMKGSHEILVHQNQMALSDGLDRIEDDEQLRDMRRLKLLVALPDNDAIQVDGRLPVDRRYARPWSVRFLYDLSRAHYQRFHTPLIVTSAARTVAFQRRLVLTNGNAAPPTGEVASPHLYGQAVDIAKHGMSLTEIAWMRAYLTPVEDSGKIDVEEEFQQACFHVSVYRRYLGLPVRKPAPAQTNLTRPLQQAKATPPPVAGKHHRLPTAMLATGLR